MTTTATTTTIHAWFSASEALAYGSSVFRKPSGSTVNVTRVNDRRESRSSYRHDEQYVGDVVRDEDGGRIEPRRRVRGITNGS